MDRPDNVELEVEFRWDDIDGFDFTGDIRDQQGCGSCYALATVSMLESRIKIWFGLERKLSSQFVLQCNFMTEGCNGGWGTHTGFFLEHFYTVDEDCAPY